jgi:hypothetical protein
MISIKQLVELQNQSVIQWHQSEMDNPFPESSLLAVVCKQHQFNYLLWHEEDIARSRDVSDSEIARVKRSIDRYNQQRNDWIEKVDDHISEMLEQDNITTNPSARLNTETPGAAIDRLSILALRIYHLREQLERTDVDESHRQSVANKLAICELQQQELAGSLQELIADLFAGRKRHRTYRQFKMYNDPNLNPFLYRSRIEMVEEGCEVLPTSHP